MSIHKRLERLEVLARDPGRTEPQKLSRAMERYFHAHENARREIEGREPLPELPYTEEDREDDMRFLEEIIQHTGQARAGRQRRRKPSSTLGSNTLERN